MGHGNKRSLHQQVYDNLQAREGFGRSKHDDKVLGLTDKYIYSYSTMKSYLKAGHVFVDWCKDPEQWQKIKTDLGHTAKTLDDLRPYVADWIKDQADRGLSAYTIKMRLSAMSKMYGERFEIKTPSVAREEITRSRRDVVRDAHFSESRNSDLVNVCRCVGFRRMELQKCRASDLVKTQEGFFVRITGKGGRSRLSPVVGSPAEVTSAVEWIRGSSGENHVPGAMDVHSYRAEYACRVYAQYARPIETLRGQRIDYTALTGKVHRDGSRIYKSAVYACRGDQKGVCFDRQAMIKASQALGHNRESVVGEHYLYGLKA